jgi:hypothetical protein
MALKFRKVTIFNGKVFKVPQCVQRIDVRSTHGWQLRYGGTKFFNDGSPDGSGAKASLAAATVELVRRINKLPAPYLLQRKPNHSKTSNLPVGISGPVVRQRRGSSVRDCSLSISIPVFGGKAQRRSVYIGTEQTYTVERFHAALERAIVMRKRAEDAYQRAATRARRAAVKGIVL